MLRMEREREREKTTMALRNGVSTSKRGKCAEGEAAGWHMV